MRRGAKPAKAQVEAKLPVARKSPKNAGSRVGDLEKSLAEAREQQTATSEILRVIASSPTEVQPIFDAIVESAIRLCDGLYSAVYLVEGDMVQLVAHNHQSLEDLRELGGLWPLPVQSPWSLICRVILERAIVHVSDMENDPTVPELARERHLAIGSRSMLAVPMLREGVPIGTIRVSRREAKPFSDTQIDLLKAFADQAVIAIENVRLFKELEEKNGALTQAHAQVSEALEQQTATAEILRVISSSPTDVQPVFDAIVRSAARLCDGYFSLVAVSDGERLHLRATHNLPPEWLKEAQGAYPAPLSGDMQVARAFRERRVIHVRDMQADPDVSAGSRRRARISGYRTWIAVPMLASGGAVGTISVSRREEKAFTEKEIALLQTFADQAVIAIENVRLFNETKEALDRQTATSEILRVISSSPTDVQPTFEAIATSAIRVCTAEEGTVFRFDGTLIHLAAHCGAVQNNLVKSVFPRPAGRGSVTARAILTRSVVHIPDVTTDPDLEQSVLVTAGFRTVLSVPMLRDGNPIGAITVSRQTVAPFSDAQVALLQTFADQAVIAIENVRLFTELQEKNQALTQAHAQVTEALEQQTATSEILRVISSSPTDLHPVFKEIVRSAAQLCESTFAALHRFDGQLVTFEAQHGMTKQEVEASIKRFPLPPDRETAVSRAILDRRTTHIHDVRRDPEYRVMAFQTSFRTVLAVPLLREGAPVGAIGLWRREVQPFSEKQVKLVETFAAQAVIAIENVRLFNETKEALERQTATAEILRVISNSPTDIQPVLEAVTESAARLCDSFDASIFRVDGDTLHLVAHRGPIIPTGPTTPLRGGFLNGRAVIERQAIHVADLQAATEEFPEGSAQARRFGWRTTLVVPLLREGVAIGTIALRRNEVQPFTEKQISLLKTFADQAVIAIENVRLFKELETRNHDLTAALDRQTATADILRVISQSQAEVQPVFDTIIRNAVQLCGAIYGTMYRLDGKTVHTVAQHNFTPEQAEYLQRMYPRLLSGLQGPLGTVLRTGTVYREADIEAAPEGDIHADVLANMRARGVRSALVVPMFRQQEVIGSINLTHREIGAFTDAHVELLKTFADQAAIAVENARLLTELQARTADLTRSVEELTALGEVSRALSSTLDLDTVLQTIVTRASQLAGTDACSVFEYDEATEAFHMRATNNLEEEVVAVARRTPTRKGEGVQGRMAVTRKPVQVPDIAREDAYRGPLRDILLRTGTRAVLAIPMLREDQLIGGLTVNKKTPGEFTPETIELLTTFATQSALAIQNARLFRELADKSRQLEVASQHKSEFLANMSHELRTPLNAIIGFSEVLTERMFGDLTEKQDEYLRDIYASGQHLLSLINDILDLSKVEAGRMELELTNFDLPQAILNALTLVRERAGRRGIALHQAVDQRLGQIRGDERKIKQVLLNLLSNALKFTPEGGRVDVRAAIVDSLAEISVTDTGVGIAPEDHEAVFEEFRQVGTSDKKVEGTGLGLALSRKFIALHGGRIWVKSQVGMGSTFTFTLPLTSDPPR